MGQVKVILREDIPRLGDAGDLVSVRPGYARNYLIPKGIAIAATAEKVKEGKGRRSARRSTNDRPPVKRDWATEE